MDILGVTIPDIPETSTEICHELTIRYSLARQESDASFTLDSGNFETYLRSLEMENKCTTKAPGVIATFWDRGRLFHSMIVGADDSHWIGSNNLNTFQQPGNRVFIDVSERLRGENKIFLQITGTEARQYDLKYYTPEMVANYVLNP